jgi:hypothetical protein
VKTTNIVLSAAVVDSQESLLEFNAQRCRENRKRSLEQPLDDLLADAMLSAFRPISLVPIEIREFQ